MELEAICNSISDLLKLKNGGIKNNYNGFCRFLDRLRKGEADAQMTTNTRREFLHLADEFKKAAVFEFDATEYKEVLEEAKKEIPDGCALFPVMPFERVVLIDDFSLVFLYDVVDHAPETEAVPPEEWRRITAGQEETIPEGYTPWVLREGKCAVYEFSHSEELGSDAAYLSLSAFSALTPTAAERSWTMTQSPPAVAALYEGVGFKFFSGTTPVPGVPPDVAGAVYQAIFKSHAAALGTAHDQMAYIDLPRHYVIEERPILSPKQERQAQRDIILPRYDTVPKYRLITPEAIRTVYRGDDEGLDTTLSRLVSPHGRRGYRKFLSSDRFKNKKGTHVTVRPTWVGSEEWEYNRLRYKVIRLDHEE